MVGIKGLTDQKASFPRIGILRKGGPKKALFNKDGSPRLDRNGKQMMSYGEDLDHFRLDAKDPDVRAQFEQAYCIDAESGQPIKPQSINVFLPHGTLKENFYTGMRGYTAGALQIECDRELIHGMRDDHGNWRKCMLDKKPACRFPECMGKDGKGRPLSCKETGMLSIIIPELKRFAYVTALTHSKWDIARLTEQLQAIEMTFGRLSNIPLVLTKREENISTPDGSGGRARRDKWLLSIEVNPVWSAQQLGALHQAAISQSSVLQIEGAPTYALPAAAPHPRRPMVEAVPVQAEVLEPEQTVNINFMNSDLWYDITRYFQNAKTLADVDKVYDHAIACIADGRLPSDAKRAIGNLREEREEVINQYQL